VLYALRAMTVQAPPAGPGADSAGTAAITAPPGPDRDRPRVVGPDGAGTGEVGLRVEPGGPAPRSARRGPAMLAGPVAGWVAVLAVAVAPAIDGLRTGRQRGHVVLSGSRALTDLAARRAWHLDLLVGPSTRYAFHQPGPTEAYLLAPFVRLLEPSAAGVYLGATVVSGGALVAAVAVIWRRYGGALALWAAAAIDWWSCCVHVSTLRDPAGPAVLLAPVVLFAVLWAAAVSGTRGAAVWSAVVVSFCVQTGLVTAPFAVVMLLVGGVAAMVAASGDGRLRLPYHWWRSPARSVGLLAFAAIWTPTVVEAWRDDPDNLRLVWDFFTASHHTAGWHAAITTAATAAATFPLGRPSPGAVVAGRNTATLIGFGAGLGLLTVLSVVVAYQRRSRAGYAFVGAAVVGSAAGVGTLVRAVGGIDASTAGWLVYAPLAVVLALGAALLGPLGPTRVGPGFKAGVKAPFKAVKKRLSKHSGGVASRARSRETAARRDASPAKDGTKAAGKAKGTAKGRLAGAAGGGGPHPGFGWERPPWWSVALLAAAAVAAAGVAVHATTTTPSVRTADAGTRSAAARFAAAVEARLPPGTRTVGFVLIGPDAWNPVAGVAVDLADRHVAVTVSPAVWTARFGHERLADRPVEARFSVSGPAPGLGSGASGVAAGQGRVVATAGGYVLRRLPVPAPPQHPGRRSDHPVRHRR
jgi:hypothetical protein